MRDNKPFHKFVMVKLINCKQCHNHDTTRTIGAGYAMDHICKGCTGKDGKPRVIAGYVEWPSEEPQDNHIPGWCPLADQVEEPEPEGDAGQDYWPVG